MLNKRLSAGRVLVLVLPAVLAACAADTPTRVANVALTPLGDLNIVRADIPPELEAARNGPYLLPAGKDCSVLTAEIHALDVVLGADLDVPASKNAPTLIERGTEAAEHSAIGAVQRTAESIVPFRSWVRKLTGAERYSRKVAAAITAGSIRRAFLKGVAAADGCVWKLPAAVEPAASQAR